MGRKEKISYQNKIDVVEKYLQGLMSIIQICSELNVGKTAARSWVRKYKSFGPSGLINKRQNTNYSTQIKLAAVTDYLNGNGSLEDICIKHKISSSGVLQQWIKKYNGHKTLKSSYSK